MIAALDALQATAAVATEAAGAATAARADAAAGFSQLLTDTANALRQAEQVSMQGLRGKASTAEVVQSVMEAERTFHTTLAIRDRLVSAWQDVSRMAI